jgi:uncharacterized phage-associated protein
MLDKLIKYFVYGTEGHITKTQLFKFLYLADLYAVKWTGKQLTELEWYYYRFGPWNQDIDEALSQMDGKEIYQESQENLIMIRLGAEAGTIKDLDLPLGLKLMLDNVKKEWAGSGKEKLNQLLEYVYSTTPMLEARNNYLPNQKIKLNLEMEREKLISKLGV